MSAGVEPSAVIAAVCFVSAAAILGFSAGNDIGYSRHAKQTCARHGEQLVYVSEQHTYCEGDAGVVLR